MGKRAFWILFVYVSVWDGSLGMDLGWRPLPTRPRYCDPASLVDYAYLDKKNRNFEYQIIILDKFAYRELNLSQKELANNQFLLSFRAEVIKCRVAENSIGPRHNSSPRFKPNFQNQL